MTSKLSYSALTMSKSLEIKMRTILSFYENLATSIAYNSDVDYFELITVESTSNHKSSENYSHNQLLNNVVDFISPLRRSNDIVTYLIEREQRSLLRLS